MSSTLPKGPASIFADLTDAEYREVLVIASDRSFEPGTQIFKEGSEGDEFYVVAEGTIEIAKEAAGGKRRFLKRVVAGDVLGEMGLFDGSAARSATAIAETACRVSAFPRDRFLDHLHKNPVVASKVLFQILDVLSTRLRTTDTRLTETIQWGFRTQA